LYGTNIKSAVLNQIFCCADDKDQGPEGRIPVFGPPDITPVLWEGKARVISQAVVDSVLTHGGLPFDGYRLADQCPKKPYESLFQSMEMLFLDTLKIEPLEL
jgi:hypothetical protein